VPVELETFTDQLQAVRRVLDGADEALLGVAFVQQRGVNLIARQLAGVGTARLVATTVFGSTTSQGLEVACDIGLAVRVLNPPQGTFHPKLYLARHDDRIVAAVGSANLTSGLVANVEAVAVISGERSTPQLQALWQVGESWWSHRDAVDWSPELVSAPREVLDPALLDRIRAAVTDNAEILTLAERRPNYIADVTPDGVWVETRRSRAAAHPPQLVEAWMIQIAWEWLTSHGSLTNRLLVSSDGLNVKRSSFVCGLLARLPGVELVSRRPIELRLTEQPGRPGSQAES